jgi:hypothetical protein
VALRDRLLPDRALSNTLRESVAHVRQVSLGIFPKVPTMLNKLHILAVKKNLPAAYYQNSNDHLIQKIKKQTSV